MHHDVREPLIVMINEIYFIGYLGGKMKMENQTLFMLIKRGAIRTNQSSILFYGRLTGLRTLKDDDINYTNYLDLCSDIGILKNTKDMKRNVKVGDGEMDLQDYQPDISSNGRKPKYKTSLVTLNE